MIDVLLGQGILGSVSIAWDRVAFHTFYQFYYKKKFRQYGSNIRWGRDFKRLVIPNSIRISCPEKISLGNNVRIDDYVFLQCDSSSEGGGIIIGDKTRINTHSHILSGSLITIQEEVLVAPFCLITSNNHCFDSDISIMFQGMKKSGEIVIGRGSWIGQNAKILGGSKLGSNNIVGAGAVVTKGEYADRSKILNSASVIR